MQIRTIRKGLEPFEFKFEPFEIYSKHWNANSNHSKGIRSIQIQIRSIRKGSIRMQIRSIRKILEAFECKNSSHSKGIRSIQMQIQTIRKDFEAF